MKILIASSIHPEAIGSLEREHEIVLSFNASEQQLVSAVPQCDVVVFRSGVRLTDTVIRQARPGTLLLRAGSGLDNVDVGSAARNSVRVVRVPGSSAQPVAEFTFALLLSLARNVTLADRLLRDRRWPKPELGGPLLSGKTLAVVGAGNIGSRVGQMAAAWGMRVLGCVATPDAAVERALRAKGIELTHFDRAVEEADFLCLHVPLTEATRHMVDGRVLARMKRGSFLVNVARGGVVDEAALRLALLQGDRVRGAALDVHELEGEGTTSPLADLPNVVLTPHIGAMASDSQRLIGHRVTELVAAHANGLLDEVLDAQEVVEMRTTVKEMAS